MRSSRDYQQRGVIHGRAPPPLLDAVGFSGKPRLAQIQITGPEQKRDCTHPYKSKTWDERAEVTLNKIKFHVRMTTLGFNPSTKGDVREFPRGSKGAHTRALEFYCGRFLPDDKCKPYPMVHHAWSYNASLEAELPPGEPWGDWKYGFIQNVKEATVRHVYDGNVGRESRISKPTLDALDETPSPLPWYSQIAVVPLDSPPLPPVIQDTPNTRASIVHPTNPKLELWQVCYEGTFLFCLAARKKTSAPLVLMFKEIRLARTWHWDGKNDRRDPESWVHRGGQFVLSEGDGNDKNVPHLQLLGVTAKHAWSSGSVTVEPCEIEELSEFNNHCLFGVCSGGKYEGGFKTT
jgi:hypothetical protein